MNLTDQQAIEILSNAIQPGVRYTRQDYVIADFALQHVSTRLGLDQKGMPLKQMPLKQIPQPEPSDISTPATDTISKKTRRRSGKHTQETPLPQS